MIFILIYILLITIIAFTTRATTVFFLLSFLFSVGGRRGEGDLQERNIFGREGTIT